MKNIYNAKNIAVHDQSQYLFRFYTSHKFSFFYYYEPVVVQYNKKYGCLSVFSKSHNVKIYDIYILIYMGLAIHNFFTYFDLYVNRLCDQTRHINF